MLEDVVNGFVMKQKKPNLDSSTIIQADHSIGCGPAAFSTGKDDPFYDVCRAHDVIDDMINAGDTEWTHEDNDAFFARNIERKYNELLKAGKPFPVRRWLYPRLVAAYRWWKA